jgi:hypothetical protein
MNLFKRRDDAFKGNVYEEDEKEPRAGLSKEIQIVITFVAVLIVGSICGFSATSGLRAKAPEAPQASAPVVDTQIPTAREAYDIAYQYVVDQGSPVELASAVGIWTPGVSDAQLASGRTGWTFYFYRPEMADMVTVVVGREENVRIESVIPWEPAPELTHVQSWRVDSPQAVEGFLANCGDSLGSVSDGVVELRLTTAAENRSVLWQTSVTSETNPLAVCEVNLDGTTGLARQ